MTNTAAIADVVLPATNAAFESDGTVTNSERRVQRVRKALDPPGQAKDDIWMITCSPAKRLGYDWGELTPHDAWEELRTLSPMHTNMSWELIEERGGVQWPCNDEFPDGAQFLHARLWDFDDPEKQGRKAPFSVVLDEPPVDELTRRVPDPADDGPPARLVQHGCADRRVHFAAPPAGGGRAVGRRRRGARRERGRARARARPVAARSSPRSLSRRRLRKGRARVHVVHFPDQVETNLLTIDAKDPQSGTAEFKATAIRVEKLPAGEPSRRSAGGRVNGSPVDLHLMSRGRVGGRASGRRRALGPEPGRFQRPVVRGRPRDTRAPDAPASGAPRAAGARRLDQRGWA